MRTQYPVGNNTHIRKNQKVIKNQNDELEVERYPKKKKPKIEQPKNNLPNCPSFEQNIWIELDRGYYCQNCEFNINKEKHQIDLKST